MCDRLDAKASCSISIWRRTGGLDKKERIEYLNFTDNMFWSALDQILKNQLCDLVPHYIKVFCKNLLLHNEPKFIKGSEVRFIESNTNDARTLLKKPQFILTTH